MKATKQKTATIKSYAVFGTKSNAVDIYYRGKIIKAFCSNDYESAIIKQAFAWARENSFNKFKLIYN